MRRSAGPARHDRSAHPAMGGVHPRPQRPGAQARGQRACGRCGDGTASGARRVHQAGRGPLIVGGAQQRHHRQRPGRQGPVVRTDREQGVSPPDLLQSA